MKKMNYALKVLAVLAAVFGIFAHNALADQITIDLPRVNVTVTKDADGFAQFTGEGIQYLSQPGEPAIPYLVVKALLPPGADLSTLQVNVERAAVTSAAVQSTEAWEIRPMPVPQVISDLPPLNASGENEAVYNTSIRFPYSIVGSISTGAFWEWQLADIPIALYHWNPVTKGLFTLESSQAVLTFEHKSVYGRRTAQTFSGMRKDRVKNMVVNFDQVAEDYPTAPTRKSSIQEKSSYVIITTNAIRSASAQMANFVQHKENRGYAVRVITENIWGGGSGDTAAENIRNWLIANYEVMNIEYVLLIGNPNPSTGDVPMKMLWPRNNATYYTQYKDSPSDYYYADLTGNWDLDGDGRFGEEDNDFGPGGVDRISEVIVGRIPYYGNSADLDSILAKTIAYQNETNQEWRKKVLLPMEPVFKTDPSFYLGEQIRNDIIVPKGWGFHRIYDNFNQYDNNAGIPIPPDTETVPCDVSNVTTVWKNSNFGAVIWFTHGWMDSASGIMTSSNAANLNNNHPSFTFQASCLTSHPETVNNLSYSLLKNGAIATVGATRVSWGGGETTYNGSSSCPGMGYEYAQRIITKNMKAGYALYDMKQTLAANSGPRWMNFTDFCLYGDPEVALIETNVTDNPPTISDIPEQTTQKGIEIMIPFTINDDFTPLDDLDLTVSPVNLMLAPLENIVVSGSGEERVLKILPGSGATGNTHITITVKDESGNTASKMFNFIVNEFADWHWEYPTSPGKGQNFYGVWGSAENDIFVVGNNGIILHYDGTISSEMISGTDSRLNGIWGTSENSVYAVGDKGTILHYDGSIWSEMQSGVLADLKNIMGISENDIFAVGNGVILHYDGSKWSEMKSGIDNSFYLEDVWGSSGSNVFAVGWIGPFDTYGVILHYDGNNWTEIPNKPSEENFFGIWGSSANDIFVCGWDGIYHYDGSNWIRQLSSSITDIFGNSSNDVYALDMSSEGCIYHYDGNQWTVVTKLYPFSLPYFTTGWIISKDKFFIVGNYSTFLNFDGIKCTEIIDENHFFFVDIWGSSANDIYAIDGRYILHYDGTHWTEKEITSFWSLSGIWGSSANDIFIVGGQGSIYHYNGYQWSQMVSGTTEDLFKIWGSAANDVFAVGRNGTILHYDGNQWSQMHTEYTNYLHSVWGTSGDNVFIAASNEILHYDGIKWTTMIDIYPSRFFDVWGSSDDNIFAVGSLGTMYHYDGNQWRQLPKVTDKYLTSIWGSNENNIFSVGSEGTIIYYNGINWIPMTSGITSWLDGVWGFSENNVYAVSQNSAILHYHPLYNKPVLLSTPDHPNITNNSGTEVLSITNAGTGSLTWTAEENEPWFSISPASGSAPGTLTATYLSNPGDQRTGKIRITAPGAANSPKEITLTQAPKAGQHFTPIWTGNPYNRMNLYVVGATLNSIPLSIGDEIAIFDGSKCVGMGIVDGTVSYEKILIIKTSQDDGSGKGFTDGHSITFRYWDVSAGQEITLVTPAFKDITTGNPIAAPVFEGMGDYGVALSSGGSSQQTLSLNKGWNIMSSYIVPQNTDMLSVVQPLITNGTLNKVISESGDTIINAFGNWTNTIGNYDPEEGYKIKLNNGSQLLITGANSAPALSNMYASTQSISIPLIAGWNIVSYPFSNSQNAMSAVQTLINAGVLEKMIDETGNSILKVFGNWTNRIGNLTAGKGYEIKVNKDAVLVLYESGVPAGRTEESREVRAATSHFTPVWTGNPFNRMNLYIAGVNASVSIGDEIAVYDGSKCVGAVVVESEISYTTPLIVTCSQDDGTGNGFTDGNAITFRLWDSSLSAESTMPVPNYMDLENGSPIAAPAFKGGEEYGVTWNAIDYRADINHNGKVNLEDAILALRIMSGITVENIYTDADVNNDQRIGMPEAVYALQKTAKLR